MQIIQKPHTHFPYKKKEEKNASDYRAHCLRTVSTLFLCIIMNALMTLTWTNIFLRLASSGVVCTWKQLREFMTISLIIIIFFFLHYSEQILMMMLWCFTMPTWHRLERVYFNKKKCEMCEKKINSNNKKSIQQCKVWSTSASMYSHSLIAHTLRRWWWWWVKRS